MARDPIKARARLTVLLWAGATAGVDAATLFVSPAGHDAASGDSWEAALRTPQAAAQRAMPGDTVVLRRGDRPYRLLAMARSGAPGAPITFRAETASAPPVFSGGLDVTDWKPAGTGGVWSAKLNRTILVTEDGQALAPASSPACTDGRWFWADDTLFLRPSAPGAPKSRIRAAGPGGIVIGAHSWIVIEGLACELNTGPCVSVKGGAHNVIRGVAARSSWRGVHITAGARSNVVEDCVVTGNREGIYISFGSGNNVIRRCQVINNGNQPLWRAGDRAGIAIGERGPNVGNTVSECRLAYNGGPDSDAALIAYEAPYTVFQNNVVHNNFGAGIFITMDSFGSVARLNHVLSNGSEAVALGYRGITALTVRNGSHSTVVTGNVLTSNHVSANSPWSDKSLGPRGAIDVRALPDQDMKNLQFLNNIVTDTRGGPDFYIAPGTQTPGLVVIP